MWKKLFKFASRFLKRTVFSCKGKWKILQFINWMVLSRQMQWLGMLSDRFTSHSQLNYTALFISSHCRIHLHDEHPAPLTFNVIVGFFNVGYLLLEDLCITRVMAITGSRIFPCWSSRSLKSVPNWLQLSDMEPFKLTTRVKGRGFTNEATT